MGKTDAVLDLIGWRLETKPRPQLYVGPSKDFIVDQLEPRIKLLLDESPALKDLVARGKREKRTRKLIAGVSLRLAWAGSATQLSSDQAGDVYVDELDRMGADVENEGDPLALVKARAFTYRDRKYVVTSTPKKGSIDVQEGKLAFWMKADQLESPIWHLWQSGTRFHWAWPCPECSEYFIPRLSVLRWPDKCSPEQAQHSAFLECPHCGGVIQEAQKSGMNARGRYVAPGQSVSADGIVSGDPPAALTASFWVSGLASPFVTFGERASAYLEAQTIGEPEKLQGVINTGFGELFVPGGGDVPELKEITERRLDSVYRRGELPAEVLHLTMTVDVQKDRLVWVVRGWGQRATSWLIDWDYFMGPTDEPEVWNTLSEFVSTPIQGMPLRLVLIDSGFRPGKPIAMPVNRVYDFCRRFPRLVRPTKGSSTVMVRPLLLSKLDVKADGKAFGLELVRLDSDHWKSWVHERIRWPADQPGSWYIPVDTDDDYCLQLISEARLRKPSGRVAWVQRYKDNHFLDCEAMQAAAAYMLGLHRLERGTEAARSAPHQTAAVPAKAPVRRSMQSSFMG